MKKVILLITVMLSGCFVFGQIPQSKELVRLYDYANILTDAQQQTLNEKLKQYEIKTGIQFAVVAIESMKKYGQRPNGGPGSNSRFQSLEELSLRWANDWGIGDIQKNDGVFYIFSLDDRVHNLRTGPGLSELMTSSDGNSICKKHVRNYKFEEYYQGIDGIVTDVIGHLGLSTADERLSAIESLRVEKQRIAAEKAEQERLEALAAEKRRQELRAWWSKTWPVLLDWLFGIIIAFVGFIFGKRIRKIYAKKKYIKSSLADLGNDQVLVNSMKQKLSSYGYPKWAELIFNEHKQSLDQIFRSYQQNFLEIQQCSHKEFEIFKQKEQELNQQFNQIKTLVNKMQHKLAERIEFYRNNAQTELDKLRQFISKSNTVIRDITRDTNIFYPDALGLLGDINELTQKLSINSRNKDSYKEVYDAVQQHTNDLNQIMENVDEVRDSILDIKTKLPQIKHTYDYVRSNRKNISTLYENLVQENQGERINELKDKKEHFDEVLKNFDSEYQVYVEFLDNMSDEQLRIIGYGSIGIFEANIELTSRFESEVLDVEQEINEAKMQFEAKLERAQDQFKKARKKVKKKHSGKKSKKQLKKSRNSS